MQTLISSVVSPLISPLMPTYNTTLLSVMTPTSLQPPFYHTTRPSLLSFMSDRITSLILPVLAYWILSFLFMWLDNAQLPYFEKRRIHESPEVIARNKATVPEVIRAVFVQHTLQTILGLLWLDDEATILRKEVYRDHLGSMAELAPKVASGTLLLLGRRTGEEVLKSHGEALVRWVYWWGIPTAQILAGFLTIDTYQYFMHRLFHTSHFLYRQIHSVHHRLYVPYAFGALYNHPLEGILFDTLSGAIAHWVCGLTARQDILLFTFSTMKTVDDHSGYRLWWDPLQIFFQNNADYHDIHHQAYGIKANFSQPYFIQWDVVLGTRMTREEADAKVRPKKVE